MKVLGFFKRLVTECYSSKEVDLELGKVNLVNNELSEEVHHLNTLLKMCKDNQELAKKKILALEKENSALVVKLGKTEKALDETISENKENVKNLSDKLGKALSSSAKHELELSKHKAKCKKELEELSAVHDTTVNELRGVINEHRNKGTVKRTGPKFTCDEVREIRKLNKEGMSNTKLGKQYDVSRSTIRRILLGETYKDC